MNSQGTQIDALTLQVCPHLPVAVNASMFMVYELYLFQYLLLPGLTGGLPVLSIVIICIRIDIHPPQEPSGAEFIVVFVDKSVSRQPISFAKNAAAFFRKRISFCASSNSR